MAGPKQETPVLFGEVLFDCFDDDCEVLGGAPFNVAWHLRGFGLDPLLISRIGDDDRGRQVRETMGAWGMRMDGLQEDARHPTGEVRIRLDRGQPTFSILPDQAYDFIDAEAAFAALPDSTSLFYHGTLAGRSDVSAAALRRVRGRVGAPVFVDINLRAPWWRQDLLSEALNAARWAKLNDQEIADLAGAEPLTDTALLEAADELRLEHRIDTLIVTLGAKGALILDRTGVARESPPPLDEVVDTVGAGDAFSAVAIVGLLSGWPPREILRRAVGFAARLCGVRGATVTDRTFYQAQMSEWARP